MDDDDTSERPQDLEIAFPAWTVETAAGHLLAETIASELAGRLDDWPLLDGPAEQRQYARTIADAVRGALVVQAAGLADVDPFMTRDLVTHIDWLTIKLAGHRRPDIDRLREQLEHYTAHLWNAADRYAAPTGGYSSKSSRS